MDCTESGRGSGDLHEITRHSIYTPFGQAFRNAPDIREPNSTATTLYLANLCIENLLRYYFISSSGTLHDTLTTPGEGQRQVPTRGEE